VEDFLPITQKQNACLDCHAVKEKKPGEPPPIPPSHYTDYRNAPGRVGGQVVGARYVCVSCHAASTDAPDLVENRFRP
jgi:nitrate reductase cytochrome c-type subunit